MVQELKQSTAIVVHIGPAVAVGDGFTPVTTLSLSTADEAEVLKHAATTVTSISGLTFTAITSCDGWYRLSLGTGETDTLGMMEVVIQDDSLVLPVHKEFMILTANAWDSKYGTDVRQVDVIQHLGTASATPTVAGVAEVDVTHIAGNATNATNVGTAGSNYSATRGLSGTALPAAAADAVGGLPISDGGGLDLDAILADTADIQPKIGSPAVDLAADIAAIPTAAEINTEIDTALADIGLDHLLSAAVVGADVTDNSIMAKIAAKGATADWDTFVNATDSLEAIRDEGSANWVTGAGGSDPSVLQTTTIATLASQVSFTLTAGSADDNAYLKMLVVVEDSATSTQKAIGVVSAYSGATKTVTLREDPGVFTMAVGDTIDIVAMSPDNLDILADTAAMEPKLGTPVTDLASDIAAVKTEADKIALVDAGAGVAGSVIEEIENRALASVCTEARLAELDGANLPTDVAAVKTEADKIALADAGAGVAGSLAEETQKRALASVCTEARLAELDGANLPADIAAIPTANENAAAIGPQRNQAFSNLSVLMVLASDGKTPAPGLTVTGQRSLDGGAFAAVSGVIAEVGSGVYQFDGLAADMNGAIVTFRFSAATAQDTVITIKTTPP